MQCHVCHSLIAQDAAFCHTCGVPQRGAVTGPTQPLQSPPEPPPAADVARTRPASSSSDIRGGVCPKCGSQDIVPNRPIIDHSYGTTYDLETTLDERPEALIFKGWQVSSILTAWICGACGYTELYASNHEELFALYKRAREQ